MTKDMFPREHLSELKELDDMLKFIYKGKDHACSYGQIEKRDYNNINSGSSIDVNSKFEKSKLFKNLQYLIINEYVEKYKLRYQYEVQFYGLTKKGLLQATGLSLEEKYISSIEDSNLDKRTKLSDIFTNYITPFIAFVAFLISIYPYIKPK